MVKPFKLSAFVMMICMAAPCNGALLAAGLPAPKADAAHAASDGPALRDAIAHVAFRGMPATPRADARSSLFLPTDSTLFAQRYGRRGWRGNGGARAAVILGAAAAIAGGAILVYANRPDCRSNPGAGGCSYGTKVIGGAMIAGGAVGIVVGAVSWR
jgi:hypothetical protein